MRLARSIVFIGVILILALNTGCKEIEPEEWFYDFTTKTDDSDWHADPTYSGTHEVVFGSGLFLNNMHLATPVAFTGDFTIRVQFTLDIINDTGTYLTFTIADQQNWEAGNYIYADLGSIGWAGHEEWVVKEKGPLGSDYPIEQATIDIPHLDREGPNTFVIVKVANKYEFFLNDGSLGSFSSKYCRGSQYFLKLFSASLLGGGIVVFKNVLVSYSGSLVNP